MKITIIFILLIILIVFIIHSRYRNSRSNSMLAANKSKIDTLEKEISTINFNYGRQIAKEKCMTCHYFKYKTDNLLEGVVQRKGERYLCLYLTKEDSLINAKDSHATQLKAFYNMANNHNFKFSPSELKAIIEFMK